jgi:hypothetical protein
MLRRNSTQDVITQLVPCQKKLFKKPLSPQKLKRVAEIRDELKTLRAQLAAIQTHR